MSTKHLFPKMRGRLMSALVVLVPLSLTAVPAIQAQVSTCEVTRAEVVRDIEQGLSEAELAKKYTGCYDAETQDPKVVPQPLAIDGLSAAAESIPGITNTQVITNTGSTYWEAITSCGYHPQRKELTCPIEIRQRWGYGGLPAVQPAGSFEYVQFCVDTGMGLQPVNVNGVHLHDEFFGVAPRWYLTAVVAADGKPSPNLFSQPLNGTTLRARAILSWAINPFGDCGFIPIWGNQADFRIRLDP